MARSCTIDQPQRPSITTRHINDNDKENDTEMKYDPCRKAYREAVKRESEISPYEKVDSPQGFTCTYVPSEANEVNLMSPISVTLDRTPSHTQVPPQPPAVGTWDEMVRDEITLGDTGAPAALDPDDMPAAISAQEQGARKEREGEGKRETWSALVEVGAVLGDDGTDVLDMDKKVKLWGLTSAV